jgi:hypothetical protein
MSVFLEIEMTERDMDALVMTELENLLEDESLSREEKRAVKKVIRLLDYPGIRRET